MPAKRLIVAFCLLLASPAVGQKGSAATAQAVTAERCSGEEHRQFDFWIGRWDVHNPGGELIGHNEITRVAGGCGLHEDWRGLGGGTGVSINTYDVERGRWTQRWVGVGATLWLEGGLHDGAMVLTGTSPRGTPRGEVLDRITWTPLPDGRIRQSWDLSGDGGETWMSSFVGLYSRAGAGSR